MEASFSALFVGDRAGFAVAKFAMFQHGIRIAAQYSNVEGEPYHERVILAKSFGSFYTMISQDGEVRDHD